METKFDSCPCGGMLLIDTEQWVIPTCADCYEEMGEPTKDPIRFIRRLCKEGWLDDKDQNKTSQKAE